jgi:apolipoprotein N-acyltransferase
MRLTCAAAAGGLGAFGQAPYDLAVVTLLSLCLGCLLFRLEPTRTALVGWAFGAGYFALTLVWIVEPFLVDIARHGWMAPFALVFLSSGLALFWAGAFWLARDLPMRPIALVLCWTAAEFLRAYAFTGFPWASPAQAAIHGPISTVLALGGPHATNLLLLLVAALVTLPAGSAPRTMRRTGQAALFFGVALALSLPDVRPPSVTTGHRVRLVQPNAEQHLKWQPAMAEMFLERQLELTAAPPEAGAAPPDLIVWPETAVPWLLETAQPVLDEIALRAEGTPVVLGVLRRSGDGLRNSLVVLSEEGAVSALYDKHHLVPFGEYIPMRPLARRLGLQALAARMGGFESGPGPEVLDFGPLGKALPLICYEAVFAHGVNRSPDRADFLLQITNDAWFGQYVGPQQHLAQARMRAIEQGLPLVRAANTGISAVIDPLGRVTAMLPLSATGFIDADLPAALPPTLYSRTGDGPLALLIVFGLARLLYISRRLRPRDSD